MKDEEILRTNQLYQFGRAVNTLVTTLGMISENMQRQHRGESMAYCEDAFQELLALNGINHDGILAALAEGLE